MKRSQLKKLNNYKYAWFQYKFIYNLQLSIYLIYLPTSSHMLAK